MNHPIFLFLFIILLTAVPASATIDNIVNDTQEAIEIAEWVKEVMEQKRWDGNWNAADTHGTPDKSTRCKDHIRSWIDIIGFERECVINGTHYVNGSAKDFAIVKRNAWHTPVGGQVVSFTTTYHISDLIVANATNNETNTTTATQTTNLHWKYKVITIYGSYWVHVYEGPLTVSSTVASPKHLLSRIPNVTTVVKSYNHSINQITYINIQEIKDVMLTRVSYNNSTISRYSQMGWVTKNEKGTELVEFVDNEIPVWHKDDDHTEIDHHGNFVTIKDLDFNISKLNIQFIAPYEVRNASTFYLQVVNGHASVPIEVVKILLNVAGATAFLLFLAGVIKRSL